MEDYTGKVIAISGQWETYTLVKVTKQTAKTVFGPTFWGDFSSPERKHMIAGAHVVVLGGAEMTDERVRDFDKRIRSLRNDAREKERAISAEFHAAVAALGKAGE